MMGRYNAFDKNQINTKIVHYPFLLTYYLVKPAKMWRVKLFQVLRLKYGILKKKKLNRFLLNIEKSWFYYLKIHIIYEIHQLIFISFLIMIRHHKKN